MKGRRLAGAVAILALALMFGAGSSLTAHAATTITVDCAVDPSALASALVVASDGDTLVIQGTCKGTFEIAHSLTLAGSGGATLDGQGAGVVLTVDAANTVDVTGLTISGGQGFIFGGGIANAGTLTLENSVVSGNAVSFNNGAGISNTGTLTLTKSTVSGNTCGCAGGGIYTDGTLTLDQSTVSGNDGIGIYEWGGAVTLTRSTVSNNSTFIGAGVGIYNVNGGTLSLEQSTVSGNTCSLCLAPGVGISNFGTATISKSIVTDNSGGNGGGVFNHGTMTLSETTVSGNSLSGIDNDGSLTVSSSTVSGNSASFGGGIVSRPGGELTITNTTVSGNTASVSGGGIFTTGPSTLTLKYDTISGNAASDSGGGIFITGDIPAELESTIVAGQTAGGNCSGLVTDGGYNLEDATSCGFSAANNSLPNTNPLLDPAGLKDNGGPTQTIALASGSPAINVIPLGTSDCGTTITTDQRGTSRPQGPACDIGAFERTPPGDLSITKSGSPNPVLSGNRLTYTIKASNNGPGDAAEVTVTDPLPNNLRFNSVSSSQGSCARSTTKPAPKDGTITCKLGDLANGASATITIVVTTTTPGTLSNTATAQSNETDPNPLNNSATATTTVIGT